MKPTNVADMVKPDEFLSELVRAQSTTALGALLKRLKIVDENRYTWDAEHPETGWIEGCLHWVPVGKDRGNAGRIKLAGSPENPIGERTINGMESLIELERALERAKDRMLAPPGSPREAVMRYFKLPPLDTIPSMPTLIEGEKPFDHARELAKKLRVRLVRSGRPVEYAVIVEDDGIGQAPERMHSRLLGLGSSDKGDKLYLIGVFGQGGSSAYAACELSWLLSRRHPSLLDGDSDGIGWTAVKLIFPVGRRDPYWAYLAAHPDGRVPSFPGAAADAIKLGHGTRIAHLKYNFGSMEPARQLYPALNHLLFNPVYPYELYTRRAEDGPDAMFGNAYRLSKLGAKNALALDKTFAGLPVDKKKE